ncbi:hypothetical protein SHAQ108633_00170 [Shewanella aquimarina]
MACFFISTSHQGESLGNLSPSLRCVKIDNMQLRGKYDTSSE